jgi:hypothetical protein
LVVEEIVKRDWLLSWGWKMHKKISVVILPELHQLKCGLRADAEVLTHKHSGHHDVMLPLFIRLNALVEV